MLDQLKSQDWTPEAAAHLLNRAGFGGSPAEIATLHARGLSGAVDSLINGEEDSDLFPPPAASVPMDVVDLKMKSKDLSEEKRKEMQKMVQREQREQTLQLRGWWLDRMRWTPFPAREKATLFWHGHWATSVEKVKDPFLIWQQNETLRANALGSARTLARDITRDPAMMRYLDLQQSKREKPNENFARELMELFTLGEGNYTERDIQESARAFTGYRIDPISRQWWLQPRQHDDGTKTFFGKTGKLSGDDVLAIIFDDPQCAKFLARKLWVFYAGSEPSPTLVEALAADYRAGDFDTGKLLKTMFLSQEFYAPDVVRRQVKSPVQWLIGLSKMLETPLPGPIVSEGILRQLGQIPFAPPNVKGWDGGRAWISSSTLLLRYNIAGYLVTGKNAGIGLPGGSAGAVRVDIEKVAPPQTSPDAVCDEIAWRLFQSSLPPAMNGKFTDYLVEHGTGATARGDLLQLMMSTPEFQLT